MTPRARALAVLALLVADGAWLFLLLGVVGFVAGLDRSPLPWGVTMGLPLLAAASRSVTARAGAARSLAGATVAVVAVYAAVALARAGERGAVGLDWPAALASGAPDSGVTATLLALLACAWLWSHGARRRTEPDPGRALLRTFRIGLVAFAVVLWLEAAGGLELGTRAMLLPFFAASLSGLAVAHSAGRLGAGLGWLGVVACGVLAVVAAGLVVAILGGVLVREGIDLVAAGWMRTAAALVEIGRAAVLVLYAATFGTREASRSGAAETLDAEPTGAGAEGASALAAVLLEIAYLIAALGTAALVVWHVRRLLDVADRGGPAFRADLALSEREPIEEGEPVLHVAELFEKLLPERVRARRARAPGPAVPGAEPGIAHAYVLYHRLLALARARGIETRPAQTPRERLPSLRAGLPDVPVDEITRRFVAACYGREAAPAGALEALGRALAQARQQGETRAGGA